ncbi:MAG: glycosyltransferase, partial [Bacilli bacterium]
IYINIFFFIYMFVYAIIFFFNTFLASLTLDDFFIRKDHMSFSKLFNETNYIPISIIVPAYNEEITIIDTIDSLLNLDYPEYEICIINDGSKDNTAKVLIEHFKLKEIRRPIRKVVTCEASVSVYESNENKVRITLVNKKNGGKSDALNMGINISRFPLFLCIDADSILGKDSLRKVVEPFLEHYNTICSGGNVKVSNGVTFDNGKVVKVEMPRKLIAKFQFIEYLRVFLTSRVAFNRFNANLIVSGAFGLFDKQAVINVGGYTTKTIGEDMELIMKLHTYYHKNNKKYYIAYVPDAVCWTQVPESLRVLKNQRKRWHVGMGQSLKISKFMLFNPTYKTVGMLSYPYFLLFEYITPLIEILGLITILLSFIFKIINIQFFILYLLVYMGFNLIVTIVSVLLEKKMFKNTMTYSMFIKLLFFCILESFGYRQLCSLFRISAFFPTNKRKWGNMIRTENNKLQKPKLT